MILRTVRNWKLITLLFALATAAVLPSTLPAADSKGSDLVQMVIELLGEKDRDFRAAGLDQVRSGAKGATAAKAYAAQLTKLEPATQVALIGALADRGDAAVRPALFDLLSSSPHEEVRAAVFSSLSKLGDASDLPLLIKALSAGSSTEQSAARASLTQMRGETIAKLLATEVSKAGSTVKAPLIEILAARRATDAIPTFVTATTDDNGQIRGAAMAALGQIGKADQVASMLPGVLKAEKGGERDNAEKNVALVCARIPNEDQRAETLIKALDHMNAEQRDQLLSVIGRVGGTKLINFVASIATGTDTARRKLGIDALSKWPDASVADKLLEITNQSTDAAERNQAFQGYLKISATRDKRNDKQRLERMKQAMKIAKTSEEQSLVINRSRTAYDVDTLRFVLPFVSQPEFAKVACETIVELAHHREVRDPNKAEFDKALDQVIATSKDPVVIDRAGRYKRGETWTKP